MKYVYWMLSEPAIKIGFKTIGVILTDHAY